MVAQWARVCVRRASRTTSARIGSNWSMRGKDCLKRSMRLSSDKKLAWEANSSRRKLGIAEYVRVV